METTNLTKDKQRHVTQQKTTHARSRNYTKTYLIYRIFIVFLYKGYSCID